jgi:hypothetical protein
VNVQTADRSETRLITSTRTASTKSTWIDWVSFSWNNTSKSSASSIYSLAACGSPPQLAGCIIDLPVTALLHCFDGAVILTAIILVECSILALNRGRCHMTMQRPDLFYAYVGAGQASNMQKSMQIGYGYMLEKARAAGDKQATKELEKIGPPPYDSPHKVEVHLKWLGRYEPESDRVPNRPCSAD